MEIRPRLELGHAHRQERLESGSKDVGALVSGRLNLVELFALFFADREADAKHLVLTRASSDERARGAEDEPKRDRVDRRAKDGRSIDAELVKLAHQAIRLRSSHVQVVVEAAVGHA